MAFSLLACNKEQPAEPVGEEKLTLDFSVSGGLEPETKGVKTNWANNDRLYIFFDQTVSENPEYLVIKYSNKTKNWVADSWTTGLESKIYHSAHGTLTALYMPNDKVEGKISFSRKYNSSTYSYTYSVSATDRAGKTFFSYVLKAVDKPYVVRNGVLSTRFAMEPAQQSYYQFCIPNKDRNGSTIANSESHYYKLSTDYVVYAPMLYNFDPASGSLYFENRPKGYMSAYFYSGLCFAGVRQSIGTGESTYYFHLLDSKNNVKYLLRAKADLSTKRAWILPALNDKDSKGNYRWEIEPEG